MTTDSTYDPVLLNLIRPERPNMDISGIVNYIRIIDKSIEQADENKRNKKYEGEFLGFRRIAGSYNQNWRWDESYI